MARIFIAYARQQELMAARLARSLSDIGVDVWIDIENIPPGMKWHKAIEQGLQVCELMLVIVTPEARESANVEAEWFDFLDRDKPVIPLIFEYTEINYRLKPLQYIDFEKQNFDDAFNQLHAELIRRNFDVVSLNSTTKHHALPHQLPLPVSDTVRNPILRLIRNNLREVIIGLLVTVVGGAILLSVPENSGSDPLSSEATTEVAQLNTLSPLEIAGATQTQVAIDFQLTLDASGLTEAANERLTATAFAPTQEAQRNATVNAIWTATQATIFAQQTANVPTLTTTTTDTPVPPVAQFTASVIRGTVPLTVIFTNTSMGEVETFAWDLNGDGTPDNTTDSTVVFTYSRTGEYPAILTVNGGGTTDSAIHLISVESPAITPSPTTSPTSTRNATHIATNTQQPLIVTEIMPTYTEATMRPSTSITKSAIFPEAESITSNNIDSLRPIQVVNAHTQYVTALAISSDGSHIATGSLDTAVRVWDTATGDLIVEYYHGSNVKDVEFNPVTNTLASSGDDNLIKIVSLDTGVIIHELRGHETVNNSGDGSVRDIAYSSDGKLLVSAGWDGQVIIWDAESGFIEVAYKSQDINIGFWDYLSIVSFHPNEHKLLIGGEIYNTQGFSRTPGIWEWSILDSTSSTIFPDYSAAFEPTSLDVSTDGLYVAVGGRNSPYNTEAQYAIHVWDLQLNILLEFPRQVENTWDVDFHPNKQLLISAHESGISAWDIDGTKLASTVAHPYVTTGVEFSPDASFIVSTGSEGTYIIWAITENYLPTCHVTPPYSTNIRGLPSASGGINGEMKVGNTYLVVGQRQGNDGFVWWQLPGKLWVRSDVVNELDNCEVVRDS